MKNDNPPCQPTLVIRSRLCSTCVVSGSRIAGGRRRQAVIYFKPSRSTRESRFVHLHLRSAFRVYCCDFLRRILDRSSSFFLTHQLNGLFFSEIKKIKSTPGPNFSWKSVDFFFCWKVCVCVCVSLYSLCFCWGDDVLLQNLSDEKSLIFSLVRWVIATHLEKLCSDPIECVFFPKFVGPNTSKRSVYKVPSKLISTNNFRTYIWHYAWDFGPFCTMWYKSYVTTFCNNYTLRGIFCRFQQLLRGSGQRRNEARKSSRFRQKSVGINAAKTGGDEWCNCNKGG